MEEWENTTACADSGVVPAETDHADTVFPGLILFKDAPR